MEEEANNANETKQKTYQILQKDVLNDENNFLVYIRVRPFTAKEQLMSEKILSPTLRSQTSPKASQQFSKEIAQNLYNQSNLMSNINIIAKIDNNEIYIRDNEYKGFDRKYKQYAFHQIFSEKDQNLDVFEAALKPNLEYFIQGYSSTIFAYGMTGSGKTHTIFGGYKGIVPNAIQNQYLGIEQPQQYERGTCYLAIDYILSQIQKSENKFRLKFSYMEIYNENVRDLLSDQQKSLLVIEDPIKGIQVQGLQDMVVTNYRQIEDFINQGNKRRVMASTISNQVSSRSHAIIQLALEMVENNKTKINPEDEIIFSKMLLIDLAGSERGTSISDNGQKGMIEGSNINKSLLALGNCINILSDKNKKKGHIPYRDSKLTRLLKDSLGGNSRTIMIACISPSQQCLEETINTLNYASRAKHIKRKVHKNMLKEYDQEAYNNEKYENIILQYKQEYQQVKDFMEKPIQCPSCSNMINNISEMFFRQSGQNPLLISQDDNHIKQAVNPIGGQPKRQSQQQQQLQQDQNCHQSQVKNMAQYKQQLIQNCQNNDVLNMLKEMKNIFVDQNNDFSQEQKHQILEKEKQNTQLELEQLYQKQIEIQKHNQNEDLDQNELKDNVEKISYDLLANLEEYIEIQQGINELEEFISQNYQQIQYLDQQLKTVYSQDVNQINEIQYKKTQLEQNNIENLDIKQKLQLAQNNNLNQRKFLKEQMIKQQQLDNPQNILLVFKDIQIKQLQMQYLEMVELNNEHQKELAHSQVQQKQSEDIILKQQQEIDELKYKLQKFENNQFNSSFFQNPDNSTMTNSVTNMASTAQSQANHNQKKGQQFIQPNNKNLIKEKNPKMYSDGDKNSKLMTQVKQLLQNSQQSTNVSSSITKLNNMILSQYKQSIPDPQAIPQVYNRSPMRLLDSCNFLKENLNKHYKMNSSSLSPKQNISISKTSNNINEDILILKQQQDGFLKQNKNNGKVDENEQNLLNNSSLYKSLSPNRNNQPFVQQQSPCFQSQNPYDLKSNSNSGDNSQSKKVSARSLSKNLKEPVITRIQLFDTKKQGIDNNIETPKQNPKNNFNYIQGYNSSNFNNYGLNNANQNQNNSLNKNNNNEFINYNSMHPLNNNSQVSNGININNNNNNYLNNNGGNSNKGSFINNKSGQQDPEIDIYGNKLSFSSNTNSNSQKLINPNTQISNHSKKLSNRYLDKITNEQIQQIQLEYDGQQKDKKSHVNKGNHVRLNSTDIQSIFANQQIEIVNDINTLDKGHDRYDSVIYRESIIQRDFQDNNNYNSLNKQGNPNIQRSNKENDPNFQNFAESKYQNDIQQQGDKLIYNTGSGYGYSQGIQSTNNQIQSENNYGNFKHQLNNPVMDSMQDNLIQTYNHNQKPKQQQQQQFGYQNNYNKNENNIQQSSPQMEIIHKTAIYLPNNLLKNKPKSNEGLLHQQIDNNLNYQKYNYINESNIKKQNPLLINEDHGQGELLGSQEMNKPSKNYYSQTNNYMPSKKN